MNFPKRPPPTDGPASRNSSVLLWQKQRRCGTVCFGDYPQPLPGVCLVAAQQPKPVNRAVLILCDIGWLQSPRSPIA
jgi:hypothetical protein